MEQRLPAGRQEAIPAGLRRPKKINTRRGGVTPPWIFIKKGEKESHG